MTKVAFLFDEKNNWLKSLIPSNLYSFRTLQAEATFALIKKFLISYPAFSRRVQKGEPSYYPKRTLLDSEINVDLSIKKNFQSRRIKLKQGAYD